VFVQLSAHGIKQGAVGARGHNVEKACAPCFLAMLAITLAEVAITFATHLEKGPVSRPFSVAGAGFGQTSTTAYRFVEIRSLQ